MRRLGLFGGTFDPVHCGHLICADQLREALGLDLVAFIPCNRSPHKPNYRPAPSRDRLRMARLATHGAPRFAVSEVEIRRGGISYTVDTVRRLRARLGPGVEIWLLMGMDAFLEIDSWKELEAIRRECRFGVACRPGYRLGARRGRVGYRVRFVETSSVDISSSAIRRRLRLGRSISFLVPEAVEAYIRRKGLYGAKRSSGRAGGGRNRCSTPASGWVD